MLSERFAAPLGLLAEGTRPSRGRLHPAPAWSCRATSWACSRVVQHDDGATAEEQARRKRAGRATETTRAYLESILGNLSSGVLAFDEGTRLRTVNPSAAVILQQPLAELIGMPIAEWGKRVAGPWRRLPNWSPKLSRRRAGNGRGKPSGWANPSRTRLMRVTRLPGTPVCRGLHRGFDDVSELVQAQRDAAWAEVAGAWLHEIKNPLTPIQLSAERLASSWPVNSKRPDQRR